jgi:hypothetical protein
MSLPLSSTPLKKSFRFSVFGFRFGRLPLSTARNQALRDPWPVIRGQVSGTSHVGRALPAKIFPLPIVSGQFPVAVFSLPPGGAGLRARHPHGPGASSRNPEPRTQKEKVPSPPWGEAWGEGTPFPPSSIGTLPGSLKNAGRRFYKLETQPPPPVPQHLRPPAAKPRTERANS